MIELNHESYLRMHEGADVLEADRFGEKVLRLPDGTFLKLFRRKRLLSSAAWRPYAQRFADNAAALSRLGIPSPRVIQVYRLPVIERDAVHYHPLEGRTLRALIDADVAGSEVRFEFGAFVARLHRLGVYFRSLHLGNVIVTPPGEMGLIDIADLSLRTRSLGRNRRDRNFCHITRYPQDAAWLNSDDAFRRGYEDA